MATSVLIETGPAGSEGKPVFEGTVSRPRQLGYQVKTNCQDSTKTLSF
jgi:hypothetical protein